MLPGATSAAGSERSRRPVPGRLRCAASYVLLSMRTQPLLTLGTAALCIAVGITHLWATQPYWVLTPEYRIASQTNDPYASPLRVEVAPGELRDLLVSEPVAKAVANTIAHDSTPEELGSLGTVSATRQAAIDAWQALRAAPGRIAAALGLSRGGEESLPSLLQVHALAIRESDRVVKIRLRATSPSAAERAPALLLDNVRELLRREDRSRTLARVEELGPLQAEAQARAREAGGAVAQYRLDIGRHDPEVSAQEIQSRLVRTRGDRADLETDLREAEANRLDISTRMQNTAVEQTTKVVVEQNQRVQELKDQISSLESKYAADLAVKTPKHQDMVRLRLEIESLKRDLNNEELLVIREKVQEPSLEYVGLLERQAQNNRQLVTLAGRELGLAETEAQLQSQLEEAMKTAEHMEELLRARVAADAALSTIDQELVQLRSRLTSVVPFSQITLVGTLTVADPSTPDEPDAPLHLLITALMAALLAVLLPTARSLIRSRVIAAWQIEQLADVLPVQLVGELPGRTQRLLARLPGRDGR